jgi:hypothetical protein
MQANQAAGATGPEDREVIGSFELLRKLHEDAVGWLKYAESKNAALAAVAAGSLYASVNLAANGSGVLSVASACAAVFFLLALALATISFLPIANPGFLALVEPPQGEKAPPNLFFFGDLAELSPEGLLERASPKGSRIGLDDPRWLDLAAQIIVNSQIARRKLTFFEWGTWVYVSGVLTPVTAFLLFWVTGGPARLRR